MPSLYAPADAVNRKLRELYARDTGGTNRKLREAWARDAAGTNRKIFSGADCQAQNWSPFVLSGDGSFSGSWTIVIEDKMGLFKLIFDGPITFAPSQTVCTISSFTNTNPNVAAMYIEDDSGNYFASGLLKNKPCIITSTVAATSKEFTFAVSQLNAGGNETLSWAAGALTFNGIQLKNIDILS